MSFLDESPGQPSGPKPESDEHKPKAGNDDDVGRACIIFCRRKSTIRWIVTGAIGGFFTAGAAFYYNNRHIPLSIVISMLLVGGIFLSFAGRQIALNHNKGTWANRWWWIIFLAYCSLAVVDLYFEEQEPAQQRSEHVEDLDAKHQTQPEYIEGTDITQKRLSEVFPFGYAVFFGGQNRILRNEIFKNGLMDWTLDVEKILIEPDFSSLTVKWTIPNVSGDTDPSASNVNGSNIVMNGGSVHFNTGTKGATITYVSKLQTGIAWPAGIVIGNRPVIHVTVLSDNQRAPVFAIGFRIADGRRLPVKP